MSDDRPQKVGRVQLENSCLIFLCVGVHQRWSAFEAVGAEFSWRTDGTYLKCRLAHRRRYNKAKVEAGELE